MAFGHMHANLRYPRGRRRRMVVQPSGSDTIYLNTAEVPRVKPIEGSGSATECMHNFTVVELRAGEVASIERTWVGVDRSSLACRLIDVQPLLRDTEGGRQFWDDFAGDWGAGRPGAACEQAQQAVHAS